MGIPDQQEHLHLLAHRGERGNLVHKKMAHEDQILYFIINCLADEILEGRDSTEPSPYIDFGIVNIHPGQYGSV
jgi:hypothetical protein